MQMNIKFKRLAQNAIAPVKAHPSDAGFDLTCTAITTEVNERGQVIIVYHTGIAVEIPEGYFGALVPRFSISKKTLELTNCLGTINAGYRGEIMAKMRTTTDVIPAIYKEGERFAQLLILPVPDVQFEEAEELSEGDRGEGGFGSTGNESSAASGSQSLPENEGEPNNSETATEQAAGENAPEQA
jgi:dUTP pyrophosphatase